MEKHVASVSVIQKRLFSQGSFPTPSGAQGMQFTCGLRPGDMVLLDNYLVMHGRCPFEGTRLHAVSWFKGLGLRDPSTT